MDERTSRWISILASLGLHAAVLALLGAVYYGSGRARTPDGPRSIRVRLAGQASALEMTPPRDEDLFLISGDEIPDPVTPESMKELLEKKVLEEGGKPEEERLADLEDSLAGLKDVRPESIDEMIEWFGLREYELSGGDADLDLGSVVVYDIEKKEFPGGDGYEVVFIDRHGTTLTGDVTPDEVNKDWNSLHRLYEMVEHDPKLEKLFRGIALKLIGEMVQRQAESD